MKSQVIQPGELSSGSSVAQRIADANQFDVVIRGSLKQLRASNRLSQLVTAKSKGITQQSVSDIERGKTRRLSLSTLHRFATAVNAHIQIILEDHSGRTITGVSTKEINNPKAFETAVRKSLEPLQQSSGLSGGLLSQQLGLTPGTVSKIKSGRTALNLHHLYDFVRTSRGHITVHISDQAGNMAWRGYSGDRPAAYTGPSKPVPASETPVGQFGIAARNALEKLSAQDGGAPGVAWSRHTRSHQPRSLQAPSHGTLPSYSAPSPATLGPQGQPASARRAKHAHRETISYDELSQKRGLNTDALLDYLQLFDAAVTVSARDAQGQQAVQFSSANMSKEDFNTEARRTLSVLRQRSALSPAAAAARLNIGPTAVRIMEKPTKHRSLRLTALDRYAAAYHGTLTFKIHDYQGRVVAQFSSANRPEEKLLPSVKDEKPEVT
ncbi:MAG: helix-turn-helix domain-containing protein [Pseudomonadota bacterium]|nr:helix-turn-helix domain-containing protein [Pseudomonadota bacterium]